MKSLRHLEAFNTKARSSCQMPRSSCRMRGSLGFGTVLLIGVILSTTFSSLTAEEFGPSEFRVVGVSRDDPDGLVVREGLGRLAKTVGSIPYDAKDVSVSTCRSTNEVKWCKIKMGNLVGWANAHYLAPKRTTVTLKFNPDGTLQRDVPPANRKGIAEDRLRLNKPPSEVSSVETTIKSLESYCRTHERQVPATEITPMVTFMEQSIVKAIERVGYQHGSNEYGRYHRTLKPQIYDGYLDLQEKWYDEDVKTGRIDSIKTESKTKIEAFDSARSEGGQVLLDCVESGCVRLIRTFDDQTTKEERTTSLQIIPQDGSLVAPTAQIIDNALRTRRILLQCVAPPGASP